MVRLISGVWNDVPYGQIGEKEYVAADRHLREHFAVVGVTEQFDAGLLLLKRTFGWQDITYRRQNVARRRLSWEALDEEAQALARRNNRWDEKLYATAVELFEKQVAAQGATFPVALAAFRLRQWGTSTYWNIRRVSVRQMIRERWKQS